MPERRDMIIEGSGALPDVPCDPAAFFADIRSDRIDPADAVAMLTALEDTAKAMNGRANVSTIGEWVEAGDRATTAFMDAYAVASRYFASDGLLEVLERLTGTSLSGAQPAQTEGALFLAGVRHKDAGKKAVRRRFRETLKPLSVQGIHVRHAYSRLEPPLNSAIHIAATTAHLKRETVERAPREMPLTLEEVLIDVHAPRWQASDAAAFLRDMHLAVRNMAQSHGSPDDGTAHWSPAVREHIEASHRATRAFLSAYAVACKYYVRDGLKQTLERVMDMEIPPLQDRYPVVSEHREAVKTVRERLALLLRPSKEEGSSEEGKEGR